MPMESEFYPTNAIKLLGDRFLFHQWLLNFQFSILHAALVTASIIAEYLFPSPSNSGQLKTIMLVDWTIGIASWFVWLCLFRRRDRAFFLRRPTRSYLMSVYFAAFVSIVPNLVSHIAIIFLNLKGGLDSISIVNFGTAILALLTLVPLQVFFLWIVYKYLLFDDEPHYEPTIQERYSDEPEGLPPPELPQRFDGPLSEAYYHQFEVETSGDNMYASDVARQNSQAVDNIVSINPVMTLVNQNCNLKCETLAHFDYMPQSHIGMASWVSRPQIPVALAILSTILLWKVLDQIHENNKEPRISSPKTIYGLHMPVIGYMLSVFYARHTLRTSLLIQVQNSLPRGWCVVEKFFRNTVFVHTETKLITENNPQLSCDPLHISSEEIANLPAREYVKRRNSKLASSSSCDDYHGHRGRSITIRRLVRPVFHRLLFLILTTFYFHKSAYNATIGTIYSLGLPANITMAEMHQRTEILRVTWQVSLTKSPLQVLVWMTFLMCVSSLMHLPLSYSQENSLLNQHGLKWTY